MAGGSSQRSHKPRELRRRVIAAARLRRPRGWCDATILNISSRGLQIQTSWPLDEGSWIELRRGNNVIRAKVIWSQGVRAGLQADELIAVDELAADNVEDTVTAPRGTERRRRPRTHEQSRWSARAVEFAGLLAIVLVLAVGVLEDFQQAFARPLAAVRQVLR